MKSKYNGTVLKVAQKVVDAFKSGNLPKAISQIFLTGERHCDSYSWTNRLIIALSGHDDAMGYKAWQRVGRQVRKGEKSTIILAPCFRKTVNEETGEERKWLSGFRGMPVFGIEQTDVVNDELWNKSNKQRAESERYVKSLPLLEVAEKWEIKVGTYNGKRSTAYGWYRRGEKIALGVKNLATWAHELCHAADDRNGKLTETGQHWRSEAVAELGSAVLLMVMGYETDADLGGAYQYISRYATQANLDVIDVCMKVINRTCQAVETILEAATQLNNQQLVTA